MESKNRSSLFQSECDQSTAKLFESNSNLDSVDVKYNSRQEETRIRRRNVKIIQRILDMFDLEETKRKYETQNVVEYVLDPNDFAYDCSLSTTRVRQRLCNLMGTDVIRLNDKRYFQKLSERLQEEYESVMDKEEEARMASENERLRRLMLEGVIENPHDYRAILHGEHNKHKHHKKKKRKSRRKKRTDTEQSAEGTVTITFQGSDEESESQTDEVVTQVEMLSRPSSAAPSSGRSKASTKTDGKIKKDKNKLTEKENGERDYEEDRKFNEMHVPPPHRPSSSCSLRRKRVKSASARVSYWDDEQESEEDSDDIQEETKSLTDSLQKKTQWKYYKTEKPLVQSLRREEYFESDIDICERLLAKTVAGLYSIAEELISPVKAEEYAKKVHKAAPKKKKMTLNY